MTGEASRYHLKVSAAAAALVNAIIAGEYFLFSAHTYGAGLILLGAMTMLALMHLQKTGDFTPRHMDAVVIVALHGAAGFTWSTILPHAVTTVQMIFLQWIIFVWIIHLAPEKVQWNVAATALGSVLTVNIAGWSLWTDMVLSKNTPWVIAASMVGVPLVVAWIVLHDDTFRGKHQLRY